MRTTLILFLAILAASPALAAGERDRLDEAVAAFRDGNAKECLKKLDGIPSDSELRPKADYLAGEAWLSLGEAAKAEKAFRAVLAAKPDAVPARTGLGKALLALDKLPDAVEELKKAVKKDGKDVDARRTLGLALARAGESKDALAALRKAWKQDRKDPLTARALVEFLVREEKLEDAMSIAKAITKARKKEPMGYFLIGLVLDREKKTDEAEEAYLLALEKDDAFLDAHKNLAILYHSVNPTYRDLDRTKKAMKHYERYFELGGRDEELKKVYLQTKGFLTQMGVLEK
jgi:tetratricopeptide (TPR) repeat protein